MAFRFRKSFKILPGVKINVSPSGFSTTIGGRGASYNINHRGGKTNGVPGKPSKLAAGCLWLVAGLGLVFAGIIVWLVAFDHGRPPYKHPVIVKGQGVHARRYASTESHSDVVGAVSTGDTLELEGMEGKWCRVNSYDPKSPLRDKGEVYVLREYLIIPDSTLKAVGAIY
ncbi:DUF4236 domain-containing protein [Hymenobacter sp. B81]|uniref:DUF4236 domain-containing protein n=1 Tax=Hymenobacter sp. B81 TaxID=3344878 RepID=UPI0037DD0CA3